jgi:hypothetical protein
MSNIFLLSISHSTEITAEERNCRSVHLKRSVSETHHADDVELLRTIPTGRQKKSFHFHPQNEGHANVVTFFFIKKCDFRFRFYFLSSMLIFLVDVHETLRI